MFDSHGISPKSPIIPSVTTLRVVLLPIPKHSQRDILSMEASTLVGLVLDWTLASLSPKVMSILA